MPKATTIKVSRETRDELNKIVDDGNFLSVDDLIQHLLKIFRQAAIKQILGGTGDAP